MGSNIFCVFEQQNLGRRFGASKMILSLLVASAVVRSDGGFVVEYLFILALIFMDVYCLVLVLLCST